MQPSVFHACIGGRKTGASTMLWHCVRSIVSRRTHSLDRSKLAIAWLSSPRYSPVDQILLAAKISDASVSGGIRTAS